MCSVLKATSSIIIKKGFKVADTIDCKILFPTWYFYYLGILPYAFQSRSLPSPPWSATLCDLLLPIKKLKTTTTKSNLCCLYTPESMVKLLVSNPFKKTESSPSPKSARSSQLWRATLQHLYHNFKSSLWWFPISAVTFVEGWGS